MCFSEEAAPREAKDEALQAVLMTSESSVGTDQRSLPGQPSSPCAWKDGLGREMADARI